MKTQVTWTVEEENIVKQHASNMETRELSKLIPRHTLKSLKCKARRLGVKSTHALRSSIGKKARGCVSLESIFFTDTSLTLNDLTNPEYQVLVGSILGDGCCRIHKGYNTQEYNTYAQYYEYHGKEQTEYLQWKMQFFERFKPNLFVKEDGGLEMITCTHPIFSGIRGLVYKAISRVRNGQEVIRMEKTFPHPNLVTKLDELGLLIWYLDDGYAGPIRSFYKKQKKEYKRYTIQPSIAVKSMDVPMLTQALTIINHNLGLTLAVYESKWKHTTNRIIKFYAANRDILLPKWKTLAQKYELPKSMWYKFGIYE